MPHWHWLFDGRNEERRGSAESSALLQERVPSAHSRIVVSLSDRQQRKHGISSCQLSLAFYRCRAFVLSNSTALSPSGSRRSPYIPIFPFSQTLIGGSFDDKVRHRRTV
jgi:hypothetical protein